MPKPVNRCFCALAALGAAAASSQALAVDFGGSIGLSSRNVYRGLPLGGDAPVWLADLHVAAGSAWSGGIAANQVRPQGGARETQLTLYLDRHWQLDGDWSARLGLAHYDWPGSRWRADLRYDEIGATLAYRESWTTTLALSPDYRGSYVHADSKRGTAAWLETAWRQPLTGGLVADVGFGYAARAATGDRDYVYASAGLSYAVGDAYLLLTRTWTSRIEQSHWWEAYEEPRASARWIASLLWTF